MQIFELFKVLKNTTHFELDFYSLIADKKQSLRKK